MKQIEKESCWEVLGVEEYIARRKKMRKEEIKKEQEKYPEPFSRYSSFLLMTL
jgi:hypothetical protein